LIAHEGELIWFWGFLWFWQPTLPEHDSPNHNRLSSNRILFRWFAEMSLPMELCAAEICDSVWDSEACRETAVILKRAYRGMKLWRLDTRILSMILVWGWFPSWNWWKT
jgi:hypothetical protein